MKERTEVSENMKWDLSSLYRSEKDFNDDLEYLSNNYTKYKEYEKTLNVAQVKWEEAKHTNDFSIFMPYLEKIVEYKRKEN